MQLVFCPDAERFIREFPRTVNLLAQQYFCQICKTQEIQERLFANLDRWKATEQWRRGMVQSAKAWLSEGDWAVEPKEPVRCVVQPPDPAAERMARYLEEEAAEEAAKGAKT
jgi:hypothetical protein